MINNEEILKSFSGDAPIFALPNFVMFPKTAYSFNVFEPRYKEMVSDILKTNKLFCVNLKKDNLESEIYNIGTLCYIIESKKLDNGNYTLIASGIQKIKINKINKTKNYDIATLDLIEDNNIVIEEQLKRKKLINKFISLVANSNENINLNIIDTSMISTEMLTNLGSLILPLENEDKQKLLELNTIELRLEVLCQFLNSELKVESDLINFNQIIPTNINWN
tara:strand:- start:525 stop:1190 length:666 start_codon:yes stop_codon:yes gene_type:complete